MMEFDDIVVKENPGLCRCCLSEGCYKDLGSEYTWMNENEVYADMLLECFDISISQINEGPNGPNRLICEVCITRLRDACNFKKQVFECEKKFIDMVARGEFRKVLIYQAHMKSEEVGPEDEIQADESEYLEEDPDFGDDEPLKREEPQPTVSAEPLQIKGKRGRPKKQPDAKPEKKKSNTDDKKTKPVAKDGNRKKEAENKSSLSATKRNRLMKRNTIIILETSTAVPFKWHRQNYLCFFCHLTFKDFGPLRQHTRSQHKNSSIKSAVYYVRRDEKVKIDVTDIACRICETAITDFNSFIDHLKSVHEKRFFEEYGYGLVPYRLNEDSFDCPICDERFAYFIKLNQHMNAHYGSYICELCGKSFLSEVRLKCHSLRHRSGFKCNVCAEVFDTMNQRNGHEMKIHKMGKKLKCLYCNETFANYTQRKRHHSAEHDVNNPEYCCPVCGKAFHILSKMRVHLSEVHVREKRFTCSVCDQRFFSSAHVQKHMVKHFGEKVHQCEVCKKSYARKQTLRDHMRIHNKDRRYPCAICSQAFVQNNSLRSHMRVHHPDLIVT